MTDDDYAENEARRMRSITAVADLTRAIAEKSQIYGLNGEELGAINALQKQVAEQARTRLEEIFHTLEEAHQRNQSRRIVKAAKQVAATQWRKTQRRHQHGHRQHQGRWVRNIETQRLSFREFVDAQIPLDNFLRDYQRGTESLH